MIYGYELVKFFSDEENEEKKSGVGKKIAKGVAGLGALAASVYGGSKFRGSDTYKDAIKKVAKFAKEKGAEKISNLLSNEAKNTGRGSWSRSIENGLGLTKKSIKEKGSELLTKGGEVANTAKEKLSVAGEQAKELINTAKGKGSEYLSAAGEQAKNLKDTVMNSAAIAKEKVNGIASGIKNFFSREEKKRGRDRTGL